MTMLVFRLCVVCALLSACARNVPPETYAATETRLYADQVIDGRRDFRRAIVGHKLRGGGVDLTVLPDGVLVGTNLGVPFVGSWEYRRDTLCTSLTEPRPRRAADRRCFRVAVNGREVTLVPLPPED